MLCRENVLNVFGLGWSYAVLETHMTTILTIGTGATLIWMNVERALKARSSRKRNNEDV
jgi:hypothetical protein